MRLSVPRIAALVVASAPLVACTDPNSLPPSKLTLQGEAYQLLGEWRYEHKSQRGDTDVHEVERWRLDVDQTQPHAIVGWYRRDATTRSRDGSRFACNLRPSFTITTIYQIRGSTHGYPFTLHEVDAKPLPSACDHEFRERTTYYATPHHDHLQLIDTTGRFAQKLLPVEPSERGLGLAPLAPLPLDNDASWQGVWSDETIDIDDAGNRRVSLEAWLLMPIGNTLTATMRRTVVVTSSDGKVIPCAGDTHYRYQLGATYVAKALTPTPLVLSPRTTTLAPHPCANATQVAKDEALVTKRGDDVILEWRGKRRQVLSRQAASAR